MCVSADRLEKTLSLCRDADEKRAKGQRQLPLFKEDLYVYRVFVTNLSRKPHNVIAEYDKRADVENSIGEAQREGILAIPSKKFQSNHAYFQIVMLAYNLWCWLKLTCTDMSRAHVSKRNTVKRPSVLRSSMKRFA